MTISSSSVLASSSSHNSSEGSGGREIGSGGSGYKQRVEKVGRRLVGGPDKEITTIFVISSVS